MSKKDFYQKLLRKLEYVSYVPPQDLGVLTPFYKQTVPFLKSAPLKALISLSIAFSLFIRLVLGSSIVNLVSLLQHGF